MISIIAAIDDHLGMGIDNGLLCHLPADLRHFKQLTLGKPIIMGRKTFESIARALPGRLNIVLSKHALMIEGVTVVESLAQALALVEHEPEIMIIGGAQLFAQTLPMAQRMYLTRIHHVFSADVFFPKWDESVWQLHRQDVFSRDEQNKYDMTFCQYDRKKTY